MKQLNEMNELELKAVAYDLILEMETIQNNLRIVNSEISKRKQNLIKSDVKEQDKPKN